ncbi:hypothetical protein [Aliikangiella sp. IMCC44359]|uniref:hypothetical protein n=1 Tax=Aliikangiella sp. IMCC44359 TaxID=3459125 RepID=UPI00403AA32A
MAEPSNQSLKQRNLHIFTKKLWHSITWIGSKVNALILFLASVAGILSLYLTFYAPPSKPPPYNSNPKQLPNSDSSGSQSIQTKPTQTKQTQLKLINPELKPEKVTIVERKLDQNQAYPINANTVTIAPPDKTVKLSKVENHQLILLPDKHAKVFANKLSELLKQKDIDNVIRLTTNTTNQPIIYINSQIELTHIDGVYSANIYYSLISNNNQALEKEYIAYGESTLSEKRAIKNAQSFTPPTLTPIELIKLFNIKKRNSLL